MGVGRAAEPEMLRRRCGGEIACFEAVRMVGGRSAWEARRRL